MLARSNCPSVVVRPYKRVKGLRPRVPWSIMQEGDGEGGVGRGLGVGV